MKPQYIEFKVRGVIIRITIEADQRIQYKLECNCHPREIEWPIYSIPNDLNSVEKEGK